MKTKTIPFDLETAKKIRAGEIEGKIVRNGHKVIILDYNSKKYSGLPLRITYLDMDEVDYIRHQGVHIEVPDNEPQFKPFDKVLTRNSDNYNWRCNFFSHLVDITDFRYITTDGGCGWKQCIPYEGNEHLVGTTDKPKEN